MLFISINLFILLILSGLCNAFLLEPCSDCNWNGVCKSTGLCACYEGFKGDTCEVDCGCEAHGVCKEDNTCSCDNGWKWSTEQNKCVWDCSCQDWVTCISAGVCGCVDTCQYGTCWNGQCECWEGYTGVTCNQLDRNIMMNQGVNFGVNLGGLSYWSPELKFVDVAKQSQEWITEQLEGSLSHIWDTHEHDNITWRKDGYPAILESNHIVGKLVLRGTAGNHAPDGNYTLLYDGEGQIQFSLVHYTIHYNGKGRMVIEFDVGNGGILIKLMKTNPQNPLRNLRLILPGFEDRHLLFPFYPPFLENLKRFSEIRFMDFFHTNGHEPEPTSWASRRLPDFHTQTGSAGAAIEYAIELVNILGADPWFNQPHAADDNFVQNFAAMAKANLRPDVKIYVEYSNEVWNGIFRQTVYSKEEGLKLGLDTANWKAGLKFYNRRSTEVANIWSTVFSESPDRAIPVWAWQTGYKDFTRQAIEDLGARAASFKALGITGYFDCDSVTSASRHNITEMTMEEIAALCQKSLVKSEENFNYYMDMAQAHNLKLLMYEGGPSLESSKNDNATSQAIAFNRHDLIENATADVLETWHQYVVENPNNTHPGGLFNYFTSVSSYSKYGSWGMMEFTGQDPYTAPKYRAVHRYINKNFNNHVIGPICSFLEYNNTAFGCYKQGNGQLVCGHSPSQGHHWTAYPPVPGNGSKALVLDGYDPSTQQLFVRNIDEIAVNTFFFLEITAPTPDWKRLTFDEYYRRLSPRDVIHRLPNGVYNGLIEASMAC